MGHHSRGLERQIKIMNKALADLEQPKERELFFKILKCKTVLPLLLRLDPELDGTIERVLKKDT